jgi:hypothetical protein
VKYLAIKNWRKYQSIDDAKGYAPYVKDYVDKDADPDRTKLSVFCAGVLDRLYRLRARYARILDNDITWLIQATYIPPRDRARMTDAIRTLTERNFIIPTDDEEFEASAAVRKDKVRDKGKNSKPQGEREESPLPRGEEKDKTNPSTVRERKNCNCPDGLCDWSEPIPGVINPSRIGNAVYYQRHVKGNDYFIPKLTRGYVLQQWQRIVGDTPEDWEYDPDPMLREKRLPIDGTDGEVDIIKEVTRRPKNVKERALLLKDPNGNRKWLYDPECLAKCSEGTVFVSDYPDDPRPSMRRLGHSELCDCVTREEYMETKA